MKRRFLFILLIFMSFTITHAYAINLLDNHEHKISKYIQEFSYQNINSTSLDIHSIHYEFHVPYIITDIFTMPKIQIFYKISHIYIKIYKHTSYNRFFKPPIIS